LLFDDGAVRPVIRAEILSAEGAWVGAPLLVDTGADRTVFSAPILEALRLRAVVTQEGIAGLGGVVGSVLIETQIRFRRAEWGSNIVFRGQYAGVTDL
jgi:predicted aspartyl protease